MNMRELEALVIAQGAKIQELQKAANADEDWPLKLGEKWQAQIEAHMRLVQRTDNIVEGFKQELAGRDERLDHLLKTCEALHDGLGDALGHIAQHQAMCDALMEANATALVRIEKLETLVLARNASAATKRNMTDEDALRVLTGDLRELSHKDAAEKAGLTYAQVYSCRLEFTFKHVHKTLRDGSTPEAPWKNSWVK